MKKVAIVIGLSLLSVAAMAQKKEAAAKPQQEKVFYVPFTQQGLGQITSEADSALVRVLRSDMRVKDATVVLGFINRVKATFTDFRDKQLAADTAKKGGK